jgi:hypothetical protein
MMTERLWQWANSPANWAGLALASTVLVLKGLGFLGASAVLLAVLAYGAGFVVAGLWLGWPWAQPSPWEALDFKDEGDAREAMHRALSGVRSLVHYNPGQRLPEALQRQVLALCDSLDGLLDQWERSKGMLPLQESFHARHIAISYLPDAIRTYLSIPAHYAGSRRLENGKTAQETFVLTLDQLQGKVKLLGDDLASQDAEAFLSHSRFLNEKFAQAPLLASDTRSSPDA